MDMTHSCNKYYREENALEYQLLNCPTSLDVGALRWPWSLTENRNITKEVVQLYKAGNQDQHNTVLLLLNDEQIIENLQEQIIEEIAEQEIAPRMAVVIFLSCANRPPKTQLAAFLALLNTYVPGSYLLESQCLDFLKLKDSNYREHRLEDRMKPFSHLIISYQQDTNSEKRVRMAHTLIAQNCTKLMAEAIEAFKEEEQLAENEHATDLKGYGNFRVSRYFNTSGKFGYVEREGRLARNETTITDNTSECLRGQEKFFRFNGVIKNYRILATVGGVEIVVKACIQNRVWKECEVSFYLGFTIRGLEAFDIQTKATENEISCLLIVCTHTGMERVSVEVTRSARSVSPRMRNCKTLCYQKHEN
ncbi:hypothetical protein Q8A73_013113 [Channa argus]|nr:hypothetical protein Q8A73_013113 [Channa argus]